MTSTTLPAAVCDALVTLLDAERSSIFRLTGSDSPYLDGADAGLRQRLQAMKEESLRNEKELADLLRPSDGPSVDAGRVRPDPSYLEFLSLKFMVPKLANCKEVMSRYYANALRALGDDGAEVRGVLERHLAQHKGDLEFLRKAGESVRGH